MGSRKSFRLTPAEQSRKRREDAERSRQWALERQAEIQKEGPLRVAYEQARQRHDSETMAAIIRKGLVLKKESSWFLDGDYRLAIEWAKSEASDFLLMDAMLSRSDIRDTVMKELFEEGLSSLKILQYLENQAVDIGKLCFESEFDVICKLLWVYRNKILFYGEAHCKELLEIIDFLKDRGVDTVRAYQYLVHDASIEDDRHDCLNFPNDCYDQVARRLKPKGGKQWKLRDFPYRDE